MKIFMFFIVVLMLGMGLLSVAIAVWPPSIPESDNTVEHPGISRYEIQGQQGRKTEKLEVDEQRLAEIVQRLDRDEKKLDEIINNAQIIHLSGPKQR